jgi:hypothetical protein
VIDVDVLPDDLVDFLDLTGKLLTPEEAMRKAITARSSARNMAL